MLPRVTAQPAVDQLVDGGAQREPAFAGSGAGVEQQRPIVAEEQVEERRLVADSHVLTKDVRVFVAGVHLDIGIGVVLGRL